MINIFKRQYEYLSNCKTPVTGSFFYVQSSKVLARLYKSGLRKAGKIAKYEIRTTIKVFVAKNLTISINIGIFNI